MNQKNHLLSVEILQPQLWTVVNHGLAVVRRGVSHHGNYQQTVCFVLWGRKGVARILRLVRSNGSTAFLCQLVRLTRSNFKTLCYCARTADELRLKGEGAVEWANRGSMGMSCFLVRYNARYNGTCSLLLHYRWLHARQLFRGSLRLTIESRIS